MTRIAAFLVYYYLYLIIYVVPLMVLFALDIKFHINAFSYVKKVGFAKQLVGLILFGYIAVVPGYRTKLAVDAYGNRDMKFWEAHSVSGTDMRTHMSFIPVIGKLFAPKSSELDSGD